MSLRLVSDPSNVDPETLNGGDLVVYPDSTNTDSAEAHLKWAVSCATAGALGNLLGRFARQSHAVCFALAYKADGWPSTETLRDAARAAIRARYTQDIDDRLADLAAALGVAEPPPRVLVVVDSGVAQAYATPGVLVATADMESKRSFRSKELAPIHSEFGDLIRKAGIHWPVSPKGRRQSAVVVAPGCAASHGLGSQRLLARVDTING